jgi:hypothetical protein
MPGVLSWRARGAPQQNLPVLAPAACVTGKRPERRVPGRDRAELIIAGARPVPAKKTAACAFRLARQARRTGTFSSSLAFRVPAIIRQVERSHQRPGRRIAGTGDLAAVTVALAGGHIPRLRLRCA